MRKGRTDLSGVINIHKEAGVTSFQVVATVRRLFGVKKCGHTGTLDPMATGVLPICAGHATRFAELLSEGEKEYTASFILGKSYDSFDTTGRLLGESSLSPTYEDVEATLRAFIGVHELIVPAFSAKKIDGKRAYELARKGEISDAGRHSMQIYNIQLLDYTYPCGIFSVHCAKGTYVRSIIHHMGELLGSGAAMSGLVRTRSGSFKLADSIKLAEIRPDEAEKLLTPVEKVLPLARAVVSKEAEKHLMNGMAPKSYEYITLPELKEGDPCLIMSADGRLIALANAHTALPLKLSKVFKD